jgi:hypothetical membrane protein
MVMDRSPVAYQRAAGTLLVLVGVVALMGITTASSVYPDYHPGEQAISDLGDRSPPVEQPAALVFNAAMVLTGLGGLAAGWLLYRGLPDPVIAGLIALWGLGALGIGVFDASVGLAHTGFALLTFAAGGLAAIRSYWLVPPAFGVLSAFLGAVALGNLFLLAVLGESSPVYVLGFGDLERWIVYPTLLWGVAFGGWVTGTHRDPDRATLTLRR